jgi:hypothetical protein
MYMSFNEHYEKDQPSISVTRNLVLNVMVSGIELLKHSTLGTSTVQTTQTDLGFKARRLQPYQSTPKFQYQSVGATICIT